jgi:hypothetical protein
MTATRRILGRARRRLMLIRGLRVTAILLTAAATLAAGYLVWTQWSDRATAWWVLAALAGAAVLGGAAVAWLTRPDDKTVAVRLDDQLELKDKLGTSLFVQSLDQQSPWGSRVQDDAEAAARGLKVGPAFPLRPTRSWGVAVLAVAVAGALGFDPFGVRDWANERRADALAERQRAEQIQQTLATAAEQVAAAQQADPPEDRAEGSGGEAIDPDDLEARLEALLTDRDLSDPEDQREAAAEVSDLQQRFAELAEQKQSEAEAVRNALSPLETSERGPADRFTDALRRGDFRGAQQELGRLADELASNDLSPAQEQRLAEQMGELAEQLEQIEQQQREEAQRQREAVRQALEEAGVEPEQAEQLANDRQATPRDAAEAAREAQNNQEQASSETPDGSESPPSSTPENSAEQDQSAGSEQASRDAAEAKQNARENDAAGDTAGDLAEKLQQMSDAMQQAQASQSGEPSASDQNPPDGQQASSESSPSGQSPPPGQPPEVPEVSEAIRQTQEKLGECAGQQQSAQQAQDANQQMQEAVEQMAQQPGGQPQSDQPTPSNQPGSEPGGSPGPQPGNSPGQQAGGTNPGEQPGPSGGPGEGPQARGAGTSPNDPNAPGGRGAGAGGGSGGNPLGQQRDPFQVGSRAERDLGDPRGGQVLSSWRRDGEPGEGESGMSFDQAVQEARTEGERAVTEQRVPKRYHQAIRRYLGNLPEQAPAE